MNEGDRNANASFSLRRLHHLVAGVDVLALALAFCVCVSSVHVSTPFVFDVFGWFDKFSASKPKHFLIRTSKFWAEARCS